MDESERDPRNRLDSARAHIIPIAECAARHFLRTISRGFVPWRLSDDGAGARRSISTAVIRNPQHFRTHALQQLATNVRCIHVPIEERPQHRSLTTCSLQIRGSMSFLMYRLDVAYLFERRQVAGAVPNAFLKAREKAASEL
jgi:hypothetical protein